MATLVITGGEEPCWYDLAAEPEVRPSCEPWPSSSRAPCDAMVVRAYRALLIGNSTFPGDPHNLPDLEGPRNDPALLREALCDHRYGLFRTDSVRLVQERTMVEVLHAIEAFFRGATKDDALLLYYSGHGQLDLSNELFLCTRDTVADHLIATAVSASQVNRIIDQSAAAATVILIDCCHAGAFKGGNIPSIWPGKGGSWSPAADRGNWPTTRTCSITPASSPTTSSRA
jgi:hypothetical protein